MEQDVGIADQQEAGKEGKDDSLLKLVPTYLKCGKICMVGLYIELFHATYHPYLVYPAFC